MERRTRGWSIGVGAAVGVALALAGCAAGQAGRAKPSGFLGDYAQLRAGQNGEALLVYVDPEARFGGYRKMLIDPITIWHASDASKLPPLEAQNLIDELDDMLRITLDDDYELVREPGPDVLRLRVAITEAEGAFRMLDAVEDDLDDDLGTGKPPPSEATRGFVAKAGVEAEILDATSGKRLAAAIDRRVGARSLTPARSAWDGVEDAFRYWAERLRERLAELRRAKPVGTPRS